MVRIRLRRVGKRKQPVYRVVVADSRSPRDGRFIEIIGQYKPLSNPSEIVFDTDKALDWLRKGARPSESVTALLKRTGIWSTFVADKGPPPKPVKKHKKVAQAKTSATEDVAEAESPAPTPEPKAEAQTGEASEEAPIGEASTEEAPEA
jgi:small subunit ribosomal protein S16